MSSSTVSTFPEEIAEFYPSAFQYLELEMA